MIGIDLVKVSRIKEMIEKKEMMDKIFNTSEITDNIMTLAGRFAAKEAYFKAKGKKGDWLDIEISNDENGRPLIRTDGKEKIEVSITHEDDYAAAVVMINAVDPSAAFPKIADF